MRAQAVDLALEVALGDLNGQASRRGEAGLAWACEAGQHQGFLAGALVDLSLPNYIVSFAGAGLRGAVSQPFQDDSCVSPGFLAHTGVEGGTATVAHLGALQQLVAV